MTPATNRRALLGTAAATIVACSIPSVYALPVASLACHESPELLALVQRAKDIDNACAEHDRQVFEPAKLKRDKAEAAAKAAHPHLTVDVGANVLGGDLVWSSGNPMHVHMARSIVEIARATGEPRPGLAAARQICAADLRRTLAIRRAQDAHDLSDIIEASDAIGAEAGNAQDAVAAFPCRTAADLALKLACIVEWGLEGWNDTLLADARRLAGQVAL